MRTVISILAGLVAVLAGYLIFINFWPSGRGSVVVISEPPGAQVWVDLEPTNVVTDGKVSEIPYGQHSVTVKLDTLMAEPFAQVVNVHGGKPDTIRFTLLPPRTEIAARTVGRQLNTAPDVEHIPTAAEVRGSPVVEDTSSVIPNHAIPADSIPHTASLPAIPPPESIDVSQRAKSSDTGVIAISSSQKGATIFVNDHQISERTPANLNLPFGTYTIHVELKGYTSSPDEQAVRVTRAAMSQSVHFTLVKPKPEVRAIMVETSPVEGRIFVDSLFTGEGKATIERDFGTYVVTFGDLEGWRKPSPVRVTLTPSKPSDSVTVKYVRLFHASAQVNGEDSVALEGVDGWSSGIIFEKGNPQLSSAFGPKFTEIPEAKGKYAWELGMGDPNRNPTGGDYVAFSFRLPDDVPPDTPLNLRLCIYKSARRYPFSLSSRSEIVVEVNGKRFLDGFAPQYSTSSADQNHFEEWSLHDALQAGNNRILVYTGNGNTVFNYLLKMEVQ
jgi:hypothetical protein